MNCKYDYMTVDTAAEYDVEHSNPANNPLFQKIEDVQKKIGALAECQYHENNARAVISLLELAIFILKKDVSD